MVFRFIITLTILAVSGLSAFAESPDKASGLSKKEMEQIRKAFQEVKRMDEVKKAQRVHEKAMGNYHDIIKAEMLKKNPSLAPAIKKMKMNLALFADAVWQSRDHEFLRTLHYPIAKLSKEERQQWEKAMKKLRAEDFAKKFRKALTADRKKAEQVRGVYSKRLGSFKKRAKKRLLEIDPKLSSVIAKLEQRKQPPGPKETSTPELLPTPEPEHQGQCDERPPACGAHLEAKKEEGSVKIAPAITDPKKD